MSLLLTMNIFHAGVSLVKFEQVNACWAVIIVLLVLKNVMSGFRRIRLILEKYIGQATKIYRSFYFENILLQSIKNYQERKF